MKKLLLLALIFSSTSPMIDNPIIDAINRGDEWLLTNALNNYKNPQALSEDINDIEAPLALASYLERWELIEILLKTKAIKNLNSISNGGTALVHALDCGQIKIAELLLKYGASIPSDTHREHKIFEEKNKGNSLYKIIDPLIKIGSDINKPGKNNMTLLHHAVKRQNYKEVKYLLHNGAYGSINVPNEESHTPFHLAAKGGSIEIAELLLVLGADIHKEFFRVYIGSSAPIHIACMKGNLDMIKLLISKGAKSHVLSSDEFSPLYLSMPHGNHNDIAIELLKHGAHKSINAKLSSALAGAILKNNLTMVKLLLYFNTRISLLVKGLRPTDDTIKHLIASPDDVESYCTEDELKEFDAIRNCAIFSSSGKDINKKLHNNPNYLDLEFKFN